MRLMRRNTFGALSAQGAPAPMRHMRMGVIGGVRAYIAELLELIERHGGTIQ